MDRLSGVTHESDLKIEEDLIAMGLGDIGQLHRPVQPHECTFLQRRGGELLGGRIDRFYTKESMADYGVTTVADAVVINDSRIVLDHRWVETAKVQPPSRTEKLWKWLFRAYISVIPRIYKRYSALYQRYSAHI